MKFLNLEHHVTHLSNGASQPAQSSGHHRREDITTQPLRSSSWESSIASWRKVKVVTCDPAETAKVLWTMTITHAEGQLFPRWFGEESTISFFPAEHIEKIP